MSERDTLLKIAMDAELADRPAEAAKLREGLGALSPLEELLGKTLVEVVMDSLSRCYFVADTGERWEMYYEPDCCASCEIEDIIGDLKDLVGSPIAMAEESTNSDAPRDPDYPSDSFTWTFYKFATAKGYVTIRWYGSSSGYYSETATFRRVVPVLSA